MTLGRLRLSVADARDLAEGALRGIGYRNDEARIIADHVIDAAIAAMSIPAWPRSSTCSRANTSNYRADP